MLRQDSAMMKEAVKQVKDPATSGSCAITGSGYLYPPILAALISLLSPPKSSKHVIVDLQLGS